MEIFGGVLGLRKNALSPDSNFITKINVYKKYVFTYLLNDCILFSLPFDGFSNFCNL